MESIITPALIREGYRFRDYLQLVEELVKVNATTGAGQTAEQIELTKLNLQRLKRIYKTCIINDSLKDLIGNIDHPMTWLMLVEAWCGDGAQIAPYFAALAECNPNIEFRLLLRDENPELMDLFLTDGKRSIPVFICLDDDLSVLTSWGPRPEPAHEIYMHFRNTSGMNKDEFHKELHLWYARDKGQTLMKEIYDLFINCCANRKTEVLT